jgi:hypothetical protein
MVLYKPWSHKDPLKSPQDTWELGFYKWRPSVFATKMLDREQNYHDSKRIAKQSRVRTTDVDGSDFETITETSTTFPDLPPDERADVVPTPIATRIISYFSFIDDASVKPSAQVVSYLSVVNSLKPQLLVLAPSALQLARWKFSISSFASKAASSQVSPFDVTQQSVLLATACVPLTQIPPQMHKEAYDNNVVKVEQLSIDSIAHIHRLNDRQRIVYEVGAATLLRAHLCGTDGEFSQFDELPSTTTHSHVRRINAILDSKHQTLLFQTGCAGTGKSASIHAIHHFAMSWGIAHRMAITAFTGNAALVVNGTTIHNFAGLSISQTASSTTTKVHLNTDDHSQSPLKQHTHASHTKELPSLVHLALLVIDEVSLLPAKLLHSLDCRLRARVSQPHKPFGGISVLFSGDMAQLPPVRLAGKPLYEILSTPTQPSTPNEPTGPTTQSTNTVVESTDYLGQQLWQSVTNVVELTTNYRAQHDPHFIDFLQHVRNGLPLKQQHVDMLSARRISADLLASEGPPPIGTPMLWFTNADVLNTNAIMVHRNAKALKQSVYRFPASITNAQTKAPLSNQSFLHHNLSLIGVVTSENRKTLLMSNVDLYLGVTCSISHGNKLLEYGVANGSQGIFVGTYPPLHQLNTVDTTVTLGDGTSTNVLLVTNPPTHLLFHIPKSSVEFPGLPRQVLPLEHTTKSNVKVPSYISPNTYNISQFQIRLWLARTVHSSQGQTLPHVIIGTFINLQGFNYTALSRATSFSDIYVVPKTKISTNSLATSIPLSLTIQHEREHKLSNAYIAAYSHRTTNI